MMSRYEEIHMHTFRRTSGFSLIELMIVVAVIGVLASIAWPSYNNSVRKTRRVAAETCLLAVAQQAERHYTTSLKYTDFVANTGICDQKALDFYAIAAPSANLTAKGFLITATPQGAQVSDSCGTLSVNQAGTKSPTTAGCW